MHPDIWHPCPGRFHARPEFYSRHQNPASSSYCHASSLSVWVLVPCAPTVNVNVQNNNKNCMGVLHAWNPFSNWRGVDFIALIRSGKLICLRTRHHDPSRSHKKWSTTAWCTDDRQGLLWSEIELEQHAYWPIGDVGAYFLATKALRSSNPSSLNNQPCE